MSDPVDAIAAELARITTIHGHWDGPDCLGRDPEEAAFLHGIPIEADAKELYETARADGHQTWAHVLIEEVAEALAAAAAGDPKNLEVELAQVGAVAAAWVRALRARA